MNLVPVGVLVFHWKGISFTNADSRQSRSDGLRDISKVTCDSFNGSGDILKTKILNLSIALSNNTCNGRSYISEDTCNIFSNTFKIVKNLVPVSVLVFHGKGISFTNADSRQSRSNGLRDVSKISSDSFNGSGD